MIYWNTEIKTELDKTYSPDIEKIFVNTYIGKLICFWRIKMSIEVLSRNSARPGQSFLKPKHQSGHFYYQFCIYVTINELRDFLIIINFLKGVLSLYSRRLCYSFEVINCLDYFCDLMIIADHEARIIGLKFKT